MLAGLYFPAVDPSPTIMPKFAANLSFMFTEVPFRERFRRAADAGFKAVEFLFPYAWESEEVAEWQRGAGVDTVLFDLSAGDWEGGDRGLACNPARKDEFDASVRQAMAYAQALACRRLLCLAGLVPPGLGEAEIRATFVRNLRMAAEALAPLGVTVMIEAINSRIDMPGYWLDTPAKAFSLLEEIARPNVRVQYDIYHAQIMAGDLARTLEANIARIGHVQIADNPGRHEPGTGEINYPFLFDRLDALGYDGWVGCEYKPKAGTEAGLEWLSKYR